MEVAVRAPDARLVFASAQENDNMDTRYFGEGLMFIDAEQLRQTEARPLAGAEIRDRNHEKVGELDGFVVDATSGRPRYAVVDAGGWFKSDRYLLPIGHLDVTSDGTATVNLDKRAISGYPNFDEADWLRSSAGDRWHYEREILVACCPDPGSDQVAADETGSYDRWPHYREPAWWQTRAAFTGKAEAGEPLAREPLADEGSPHFGGRAQPGDVLGIETDGERSYLGDTAEDEDDRREDAEATVSKARNR
jgi:hypothetical protein